MITKEQFDVLLNNILANPTDDVALLETVNQIRQSDEALRSSLLDTDTKYNKLRDSSIANFMGLGSEEEARSTTATPTEQEPGEEIVDTVEDKIITADDIFDVVLEEGKR